MLTKLLFLGQDTGLWSFDEASGVASLLQAGATGGEFHLVSDGTTAYFALQPPSASVTSDTQLWTTNGTAGGTRLVTNLPQAMSATGSADIRSMLPLPGGEVAFSYTDGATTSVYVSDGTAAGTRAVSGYSGADPVISAAGAAVMGPSLLFLDRFSGLWTVDPSTAVATHLIASGAGAAINDWANLAVDGGYVYFGLQAPGAGANTTTQLWRSDGTAGGTQLVETFADNSGAGVIGTEQDRAGILGVTTLANGQLAISTFDGAHYQVYLSNGTAAGTAVVTGYTGDLGAYLGPDGTSEVGGALVFQAADPLALLGQLNQDEVWSLNEATGVTTELASGSIGDWSVNQAVIGGNVYYTLQVEGAAAANETQLWATDGTPAGTRLAVTLPAATTDHVDAGIQTMMPTAGDQLAVNFFNGLTDLVGTTDGTQSGTKAMAAYAGGFAGFGTGLSAEIGDSIPCFCPGTLILTPDGERAVETLRIGDLLRSATGESRPIVWIGSGRVLLRRGQRCAATPVIVRRGALGLDVPHHDLHITKGHSLFTDDVLIPAEFLVNHRSIRWDDHAQAVEFYHIELDTHAVLLANGAPAESYRDDGNRWLFQNANSGWAMPPKPSCAPVLTGGPIVDAVWRRLLDRAGRRPGMPLTGDPDLHLLVDGTRLDAEVRTGGFHVFSLPRAPDEMRIVSRSAAPQELGLARDPRCLGVAVRRIILRQQTRCRKFGAENELLLEGFHGFEADEGFRWTNGDALLPPEMFAGLAGSIEVVLQIGGTAQYVEGFAASRAA